MPDERKCASLKAVIAAQNMSMSRLKGARATFLCISCPHRLLGVTATVAKNVSKPFINYSRHRNVSDKVMTQ